MDIQQAIKQKCKERKITLKTVAGRMGVSSVTLWNKLSGSDIKVGDLKMIASILDCDIDLKIVNGVEDLTLTER